MKTSLKILMGLLALLLVFAPLRAISQADDLLPVGAKAPDFTLKRLDGKTVKLSTLLKTNKVVLVNFWMIH